MEPPNAKLVAKRLLILLAVKQRAQRLMMLWDFGFRMRESFQTHFGLTPVWKSLGWRGEWLRLKARWKFQNERRWFRWTLRAWRLSSALAKSEREFVRLGLSQSARDAANEVFWQIESIACLAWALRMLPKLPPPDQPAALDFDEDSPWSSPGDFISQASLRSRIQLDSARENVKRWHWRARQHLLERRGQLQWPPPNSTPQALADLERLGIVSLDTFNRFTVRTLRDKDLLEETIDDDFPARGKAYRELTEEEGNELEQIAHHRHKALNWLCGLAPANNWDATPVET